MVKTHVNEKCHNKIKENLAKVEFGEAPKDYTNTPERSFATWNQDEDGDYYQGQVNAKNKPDGKGVHIIC